MSGACPPADGGTAARAGGGLRVSEPEGSEGRGRGSQRGGCVLGPGPSQAPGGTGGAVPGCPAPPPQSWPHTGRCSFSLIFFGRNLTLPRSRSAGPGEARPSLTCSQNGLRFERCSLRQLWRLPGSLQRGRGPREHAGRQQAPPHRPEPPTARTPAPDLSPTPPLRSVGPSRGAQHPQLCTVAPDLLVS